MEDRMSDLVKPVTWTLRGVIHASLLVFYEPAYHVLSLLFYGLRERCCLRSPLRHKSKRRRRRRLRRLIPR